MPRARTTLILDRRALRIAFALAFGVVSLAGCAKKVPVAQAPPPPLEVPVVPPRLVGPVVVEEPPTPTAEAPEPAPPRQRAPRPAARGNGGTNEPPIVKVEPPPESAGKTPDPAAGQTAGSASGSASAAAAAAPLLRTPDSADDEGVAKSVRETLTRAEQNLNKVNYNALNAGAKEQHDTARRFIAAAQAALKTRRLDFARYVADKAERLSASLLNR
jgi:hypothetical protein